MAPGAFPVTLAGSATRQLGAAIGGNNVKEFEEGAASLYPVSVYDTRLMVFTFHNRS